ncbi:RES family NAD+ phosphorylase [[Mycobacterium] vasticus]|uniref:RES family NAD+ phosphorylase n=1 Tax=[Mycobacterium] vasticus TaxID=2875777 RepID=A0ABU5Z4J6_9MYCO|nr:RES family NAD+ phosphorylase [Mycolicibacter sp. MYC017]MEB3071534.1 RES family NAD+ phosphorylase [Mycolicibacter sp. MYC017]
MVTGPPSPFDPDIAILPAAELLYRVMTATRTATEFNPGVGGATRFAFFGKPVVPVMYAADSEMAAIAETLLHDIPVDGGILPYDKYSNKALVRVETTRDLRVAVLHGLGLRRLKATATELTAGPASSYPDTVKWAQAAHAIGLDGMVWMSRMCNDAKAYVFFGDRCGASAPAFVQDPSHARIFASPADQIWLIDRCAPLHVDVLLEPR